MLMPWLDGVHLIPSLVLTAPLTTDSIGSARTAEKILQEISRGECLREKLAHRDS